MARTFQPEEPNRPTSERAKKFRRQMILGWLFVAFWFAFVGAFDVYLISRLAKQASSVSAWKQTTGVIQSSQVVTGRGTHGSKTYRPEISYSYEVDGRPFSSDIIEAGGTAGFRGSDATRIVQANPVGATVPVFYDSSDPADSALVVGLQPRAFMMVLFILPFNAVLVGMIVFLLRARSYADDPLLGRVVFDDGNRAVLRLSQLAPLTAGCLGVGIAAFVGIFVAVLGWSGEPPLQVASSIFACSLVVGCVAAFWRAASIASGKFDIEVDRSFKRLSLPQSRKAYNQESLKFSDVLLTLEVDSKRKMNNNSAWKLHVRGKSDADPRYTALWLTFTDASMLAAWLSKQTGVPVNRLNATDLDE